MTRTFLPPLLLLLAIPGLALAVSPDKAPVSDPSPESELASFVIHPDFEASLYADETLGIANPVAIQWDPQGRLWVLCTLAYAQLKPGETPDDKLFILEDTNGDGKADRSTLFADGLNMPMGFALGHGGAWVAADTELLFLRDTDGDGRADDRRVVLSGFGTGDTHQNISNLVFDAGGFLYFTQGLHTFSQVETPWGVSRGDTAGFWRFDPRLQRLDPFGFPSMTSQNPCGATLDRWGALFIKSNGPHLCFATPGLVPTTRPRELMQFAQVGQTPGKSMGVDIVSSAHLPDWIQDHAIIAGYFAREVSAIPLVEDGAGFAASLPVQLVYGGHESFRPVDIRQGPDGAIYVADWFNPIINHYQVSLRHPDRDYSRGRIWKLTAKGRVPVKRPDLVKMEIPDLVEQLRNSERWPREQARRMLSDHERPEHVAEALKSWFKTLKPGEDVPLVEAAGVLESLGATDGLLLYRLRASDEPRVRAVAARIIARSPEPMADEQNYLAHLLADPHPRPRLEAVIACANRPGTESLKLALTALDAGEDRFVEYSLGQTVFALEKDWLPALREGRLRFERPGHLAFVLETYGGEVAVELARKALDEELEPPDQRRLLLVLARLGGRAEVETVFATASEQGDLGLLEELAAIAKERRIAPSGPYEERLRELLHSDDDALLVVACRLAGSWKAAALADELEALARSARPAFLIHPAIQALAEIRGKEAKEFLLSLLGSKANADAAFFALADAVPETAAEWLVGRASESGDATPVRVIRLLKQPQGAAALASALEKAESFPTQAAESWLELTYANGVTHADLVESLNRALGRQSGAPDYDPDRVAAVVAAVREGRGDAGRGAEVYRLPQLACVACHQIGDEGGVIGPSLNGLGAGMPLDQIVESILWPDRQIKEGYEAVAFTTKAGAAITGYVEREAEDIVWYRNAATPWILPLAKKDIARREAIPSLMPPGLTVSLSEQEFLDLVAYLASLKG